LVHEDDVRTVVLQVAKRAFGGIERIHRELVALEQTRQDDARGFRIVDDQRALP